MSDKPTGEKCPTCGYQLVTLDNDELAKLTEKAAYHELREQLAAAHAQYEKLAVASVELAKQLAAEREKADNATENCMSLSKLLYETRQQLAAAVEALKACKPLCDELDREDITTLIDDALAKVSNVRQ